MAEIFVGRQPIFDANLSVAGYELLFRPAAGGASPADGEQATAAVIVNTFMEFGLPAIVGDKLPFVNVTRPFLCGDLPLPFPAGTAVLEIVESVVADADVMAHARRLVRAGHRVALDDFCWQESMLPLLELAEIVKIDLPCIAPDRLGELVGRCRERGVAVLAEKVETAEQLARCQALGFDYYQGYLLGRPKTVQGRGLEPAKLACLDLMAALGDPRSSLRDIERRLHADPALAYRALRMVNSAAAGLSRRVSSLRDAVVLLGRSTLRAWLLVMALADSSPVSSEQLSHTLGRARMCELLAPGVVGVAPEAAFTAGLLSTIDALVGQSMLELTRQLPLDEPLLDALLRRTGALGELLATVTAYEDAAPSSMWPLALSIDEVRHAYVEATSWATRSCSVATAGVAEIAEATL
jgi:EAL and modified HD-GYP domain-containing signal transduction protein